MATIEISKIQLRRGSDADLQPTSLDAGELCFTTDLGRLYIGPDSNLTSHPRKGRDIHPYENVEVLTEMSIDTFARMHDRLERAVGPVGLTEGDLARKPYLSSVLTANNNDAIRVDRVNTATGLYDVGLPEAVVLAEADSVGSVIQYFLFEETTGHLVRSGTLTINHNGVSTHTEAYVEDNYVIRSHLSSGSTVFTVGAAYESTAVRFQATLDSGRITLEYNNNTAKDYVMQFRLQTSAILTP